MRPIGWTLTCALLAVAFPKSAILPCVECVGVVTNEHEGVERAKLDELSRPISKDAVLHPLVRQLREFLGGIFDNQSNLRAEARTFGHKRIQFMLMPMMYKMGAMMTMLTVLTVISLKGLLIGAILLMLKVSTLIAKFSSGWQHHAPAGPAQPIHVHVHNSLPTAHQQAYSGWMSHSGPDDEQHYYYRG
nr:PREDICTED: uncharacterized protein LOC100877248 isoform X1 [Megachile rotundata]